MIKIAAEGVITKRRLLTKYQKDFLLNNFFYNEGWSGWKDIAIKLLDNGSCVVAGNSCIWIGGIGNFINVISPDNYFDCLEYTFDLEEFLTSKWYEETLSKYLHTLITKSEYLNKELSELSDL